MHGKFLLVTAIATFMLTVSVSAQDQKAPAQMSQAGQGMMMPPEMMARMSKMMDQCEKMMGEHTMKGMRRHKKS